MHRNERGQVIGIIAREMGVDQERLDEMVTRLGERDEKGELFEGLKDIPESKGESVLLGVVFAEMFEVSEEERKQDLDCQMYR